MRAGDECVVGDTDPVTDSFALRTSFRGVKVLDGTGASPECCRGRKAAVICEGNRSGEIRAVFLEAESVDRAAVLCDGTKLS